MQAQATAPAHDADAPGFGEYVGILSKRRRLLLAIAAPIVAIGLILAVALPDIYRSTGLIEIEDAENLTTAGNLNAAVARDSEEPLYADQYVQSLSTVVLSSKNLRKLLAAHELYDDQEADSTEAVNKLRDDIDVDIVTVPIIDPKTGREREVVTAFTVSYDNRDPGRAHQGATWLVDAFLDENRRDRQGDAANAAQFFGGEAERMRKYVGTLEGKLAEFKAKNVGQLPELAQMNLNVMDRTENEIQSVESQIQALRRERVFLVSQLQQAKAAAPEGATLRQLEEDYRRRSVQYDESHPDMISLRRQIDTLRAGGSTAGMTLRAQLQQQRAVLAESRQRYSEDHPDIKRIQRNIQALETRIAAGETMDASAMADSPMAMQVQTQLNATDTQIAALQVRATGLRAKLTDLETRITAAPAVEREFQTVTRDLASARTKYEELLKRQMDAEVSQAAIAGGTADKFRVKTAPSVPDGPAKPPRLALLLVSFVLAGIAGVTGVVLAQLLDQTVRGIRDVREILDVTPLSAVPIIRQGNAKAGWFPFGRRNREHPSAPQPAT